MQKVQSYKQQYKPNVKKDGSNKVINMHNRYQINSDCILYKDIQRLIELLLIKQKNKPKDHLIKVVDYTYFPSFQFLLQKIQPHHQLCCICQFEYELQSNFEEEATKYDGHDIICTTRCQHLFHKQCLTNFVGKNQWMKCPVCSVIYGTIKGDQPDGTMTVTKDKRPIPGYDKFGTIVISYNFPSGQRNGKKFPGTSRIGYLPDNEQGQKVLKLLQKSFQRKLTFTVGRSVTTGAQNVIVWNGIHHKTSVYGGSAQFGYPDNTYLYRVTQQLAAKGIYD